jgi:hypothetical protein
MLKSMYKLIFLLSMLFQVRDAFGQRFLVTQANDNAIYVGIQNPIHLLAEGVPCKSIIVKSDNGTIESSGTDCWFTIQPQTLGIAKIEIFKRSGRKLVLIGSHSISVRAIPDPKPYVGNLKGGNAKKSVFIAMGGVIAKGEVVHNDGLVRSFSVAIYRDNRYFISMHNTGNRFEDSTVEILKLLRTGDRVVISSILAETSLGRSITLQPIEYCIVD